MHAWPRRSADPRRAGFLRRWLTRFLASLGLLLLVVTFTPLVYWWAKVLSGPMADPKGDVLIVFAGSQWGDGTLGYSSLVRARYAGWALKAGDVQQVVISGGGDPSVSSAMKRLMVCEGADPNAIQLEEKSLSTHENAREIAVRLRGDQRRLVLMTSDYHMFRALRTLRHAGVEAKPRPIPDARKRYQLIAGRWGAFTDVVTESAKIAYYKYKGWI